MKDKRTNFVFKEFKMKFKHFKLIHRKNELQKIFERFDQDNNKTISFEEARIVLKDYQFTEDEIHRLFELHDRNHDGVLNYAEFVHFWNACGGKVPKGFKP